MFAATGFFLDEDTFYKERKVLKPAYNYRVDGDRVIECKPWFQWNYQPREISFKKVVTEFSDLFEAIIAEQVRDEKVILPLSGGLDSRTQAAALAHLKKRVHAYSYSFYRGHDETSYSRKIAKECSFGFTAWQIPKGYLWPEIKRLADLNGCYSEFTHPRSMAFIDQYQELGEVFSLGHWGDVLFDGMGIDDDLSIDEQVTILMKKIIKRGGVDLATKLWEAWKIDGDFLDYFRARIKMLLSEINISNNANAQIRAFKSLYWAPRWTSASLSIFESAAAITLPYYDDRMCQFICTVPESFLASRQIQIAYLKKRAPKLAAITWQDHRPYNLYNYQWDKTPWNLPYRVWDKARRVTQALLSGPLVQRNWEIQFLGESNEAQLKSFLFDDLSVENWIPQSVVTHFFKKFKEEDALHNSHPVSMLLTLRLFDKMFESSNGK